MGFGRNPHVAKAEAAQAKAKEARDAASEVRAYREAAHLWDRAAAKEKVGKRRAEYEAQPGMVDDVLIAGTRRVRGIAQETMGLVDEAMGLYGPQLLKAYAQPLNDSAMPTLAYC